MIRSTLLRAALPLGLALFGVGAWFVSGGCRGGEPGASPDLVLSLSMSPTPPMVGPAQVVVSLQDTAGMPLEGAQVVVRGDMTHAGMTPVMDTARVVGPGRYAVQAFRFTMAGDWVLSVEAWLPDGRSASARERVSVLTPPPGLDPDSGLAMRPATGLAGAAAR